MFYLVFYPQGHREHKTTTSKSLLRPALNAGVHCMRPCYNLVALLPQDLKTVSVQYSPVSSTVCQQASSEGSV